MFNPLTGTEAAGNATLTPHPVPADPALHTLERSELDRAVFGVRRSADGACMCAASFHIQARARTNFRCGLCAQPNAVSAVSCDKHRQYHRHVTPR